MANPLQCISPALKLPGEELKIISATGQAFADLPESWVCPVCAADKSVFSVDPARRQAGMTYREVVNQ